MSDSPVRTLPAPISLALPAAASEQASLDTVLDALAPVFEQAVSTDEERAGALLVVSDDAGSATAVQFWRDALATGLALASPGAFPWCLANAPCATLARRFAITGPNITWLAPLADAHAFDAPAAWLADYLAPQSANAATRHAWLLVLHFGQPGGRAMAWHFTSREQYPETGEVQQRAAALQRRLRNDWLLANG